MQQSHRTDLLRVGSRLRRHRRPPSRRPSDLPLVTERVDDPTKTPSVLDGDRRSLCRTRSNGPFDERVRIVNGHEDAASPASDRAGAETAHALCRRADPERPVADSELGDDVLAVANAMQDTSTKALS